MATKIRLQRHGRKSYAFYSIHEMVDSLKRLVRIIRTLILPQ